jgi:site-specific recombinase XerC
MKHTRRRKHARAILRLTDLEHAKSAVLNSPASPESRRSYEFAIQNFVEWYCLEPRLALNRIVVTRYRMRLERLRLAPSTINQWLAAVRRLAYEASDAGLLSPELAAGIRRVKGVKQLNVRLGNWLTAEEGRRALVNAPASETLRGKRDRAILAVLLGYGLRWSELTRLKVEHLRRREEQWAVVDLIGKGGHVRTVPILRPPLSCVRW